jgi:hypothetical protein
VGFGPANNVINSSYLVRKTDGAVFNMGKAGNPTRGSGISSFSNEKLLKLDNNNNLYYLSGYAPKTTVFKINLNGINSLSSISLTPTTDNVTSFDVDSQGNIIYSYNQFSTNSSVSSSSGFRIRKANGGLYNPNNASGFWIDLNGKITYISPHTTYPISNTIKNVIIDNNYNVSEETYGSLSYIFSTYSSYKIELANRILIISGNNIYEVFNPSNTPRTVSLNNLTIRNIKSVMATENYYYIAGVDTANNNFFIKVNPLTDAYTQILNGNDYELLSFVASESAGITFNALRMSDGKKVIGKVSINGGTVQILDEESNVQISYLERIN